MQQSLQQVLKLKLNGKMKKVKQKTFLANQVPLAWVTHSLEWIPVSIQMAGRLLPVLNCRTGSVVVVVVRF